MERRGRDVQKRGCVSETNKRDACCQTQPPPTLPSLSATMKDVQMTEVKLENGASISKDVKMNGSSSPVKPTIAASKNHESKPTWVVHSTRTCLKMLAASHP